MAIKTADLNVYNFLQANQDKTVSDVMSELVKLMSGSDRIESAHRKNELGEVTHVFCYYHKCWEDVTQHAYGAKAGTATGLNSMCKVGVNQWSKQQRIAKHAKSVLLECVASGEVAASDIPAALAEIEAARTAIVPAS